MLDTLKRILSDPILNDHHKVQAARAALGQLEKYSERPVTIDTFFNDLETLMVDATRIENGRPMALLLALVRQKFIDGPDAVGHALHAVVNANREAHAAASRN